MPSLNFGKFAAIVFSAAMLTGIGNGRAEQTPDNVFAQFAGPDDTHHSYFINGLASAIPEVGYGLRSMSGSLSGHHYAYITPVESTLPIPAMVIADIRRHMTQNPNIKINLVGVSYGGNIATIIAQQLKFYDIDVNYLAILDAPAPVPVTSNVHRVDNFYCRRIGCIGQPVTLAWGNNDTIKQEFKISSGHVELSANPQIERRITGQLSEIAMDLDFPSVASDPAQQ